MRKYEINIKNLNLRKPWRRHLLVVIYVNLLLSFLKSILLIELSTHLLLCLDIPPVVL